ncbi:hypothetical protein [Methanoregula sp.]|uniref:hypothetical protein n=1 Tax=Methanoregula sp. TaxID=2052170 RepID=UPI003565DE2F
MPPSTAAGKCMIRPTEKPFTTERLSKDMPASCKSHTKQKDHYSGNVNAGN